MPENPRTPSGAMDPAGRHLMMNAANTMTMTNPISRFFTPTSA
jgi:hypothetical protein